MHTSPFLTHEQRETTLFLLYPLCCYSFHFDLACLFLCSVLLHLISKREERTLRWKCSWQMQPRQHSQNTSCHVTFPLHTESTKSLCGKSWILIPTQLIKVHQSPNHMPHSLWKPAFSCQNLSSCQSILFVLLCSSYIVWFFFITVVLIPICLTS